MIKVAVQALLAFIIEGERRKMGLNLGRAQKTRKFLFFGLSSVFVKNSLRSFLEVDRRIIRYKRKAFISFRS